jgi:hypothetical protein
MQRGKNFGTPRGQISDRNIKMSRKKKSQMCVYMDKTSFLGVLAKIVLDT